MTDILLDEFLEHHGIKGMKWGVRKTEDDSNASHKKRNAAIILGTAAAIAAVTVGTIYAKKHMNIPISSVGKSSSVVEKFAESLAKEPVGIIHSSRGKNIGYAFLQGGGLKDPTKEAVEAGLDKADIGFFKRYGKDNEKIAARFADPLGRHDASKRPIGHDVILPKSMTKNVHNVNDVEKLVWPLIKDIYRPFYESAQGSHGPGY